MYLPSLCVPYFFVLASTNHTTCSRNEETDNITVNGEQEPSKTGTYLPLRTRIAVLYLIIIKLENMAFT